MVKVFDDEVTLPATGSDVWVDIELDVPFEYNAAQNLVIGVYRKTTGSIAGIALDAFRRDSAGSGVYRSLRLDDTNPISQGTGTQNVHIPNIKLQFGEGSGVAPDPIELVSPENRDYDVERDVLFTWKYNDGFVPESLKIVLDTKFPPEAEYVITDLTTPEYEHDVELAEDTTYYWQIVAIYDGDKEEKSAVWSFSTGANVSAILLYPGNNSSAIPVKPTFEWEALEEYEIVQYVIYLGKTSELPDLPAVGWIEFDDFDEYEEDGVFYWEYTGNLDYFTTYHWYVIAELSNGSKMPVRVKMREGN